ncbi:MAG: hypothetical protein H7A46_26585 [Verrucomicrobiales bacterium]|nr:hypothetical protein [Verrucomicrobiales bacterium]
MSSLSVQLFREVRPEFFRILSGPLARLYVDVLDALEQEAGRRSGGLDREEALGIAEQVVERGEHRPAEEADPVLHGADVRERARIVLEVLREAGWLEEPERSDWRRVMHLDANAALLLQTLRKMAFPDAAVFSDKLVSVCVALVNRNALAEEPWAQVESCVANLQTGLAELRGMARSIVRHTREQLSTTTLRENLAVLFDQFAERIGRACYAQLVQARLPSRLAEARRALEELEVNPGALERMQTEVLRRTPALSPETAMARVRQRLNDLAELLDQVEPLADAIDRRTAEFARRSQARFRYLQETTGENRARVQAFFETLNRHFAGRSVRDLEGLDLEFPALRLHDPRIFGGLESLYTPRLRRAAGEIEPLGDTDPDHEDRTLAELENTLRESLTVSRANGFVASLPGGRGARMDSVALLQERVLNDEDIADLVACLLHAGSADARYRVEVPRKEADADHGEFDRALNYRVERFTLIKR